MIKFNLCLLMATVASSTSTTATATAVTATTAAATTTTAASATETTTTASPAVLEMHASGTTNPSKLHWKYMETLEEQLGQPLLMTYRAVGSGTGQKEFLANANHFGGSEIPLTEDQQKDFGEEVLTIPHVIGGIAFFHNVPLEGESDKLLHLPPILLIAIFQRDIETWDHPDILDANPGFNPPAGQQIRVIHRKKGSSSTHLIAEYFSAVSSEWKLGVDKVLNWPEDTIAAEGSAGVSDGILATPYSIGYVDMNHGHRLGLQEVMLQNKDGFWLTSAQADPGAAALSANLPASHESWDGVSLINEAGEQTWPIVSFSYMLVKSDLTGLGDTAALVQAYLKYALSEAGQGIVSDFGFAPVPAKVEAINSDGLRRLDIGDVEPFSFETSTDAVVGAGKRVFSVKRRQYSDYESQHNTMLIAQMAAQITDLLNKVQKANHASQIEAQASEIKAIQKKLSGVSAQQATPTNEAGETADNSVIAIAGLVLSLIACILSSASLYITLTRSGAPKKPYQSVQMGDSASA